MAFASTTFARPIRSALGPASHVQETRDLDSTLTELPVLGNVLDPVAALLDSVGLNDPATLAGNAPLNDEQKETLKKLQSAVSAAANKVESELPVHPPIPRSGKSSSISYLVFVLILSTVFEARDLDSILTGLPVVGSVLTPIASLFDSIGLSDPSKLTAKTPLTAEQQSTLNKLQAALESATATVKATLPHPDVPEPLQAIADPLHLGVNARRQFSEEGSGWGALFDEESGTLDPEDGLSGYLKRSPLEIRGLGDLVSGLPILGPILGPVLQPVTSLLDSLGLGDVTNKLPLSTDQLDAVAKLQAAIATVTGNVKSTLPVSLPLPL